MSRRRNVSVYGRYDLKHLINVLDNHVEFQSDTSRKVEFNLFDFSFRTNSLIRLIYNAYPEVKCKRCNVECNTFEIRKFKNEEYPHIYFVVESRTKRNKKIAMSQDHIIPMSKNGISNYVNLELMCMHCNSKKGSEVDERIVPVRVISMREISALANASGLKNEDYMDILMQEYHDRKTQKCTFDAGLMCIEEFESFIKKHDLNISYTEEELKFAPLYK